MQYLYGIISILKGVDYMKKRVTYTLEEETINRLRAYSDKTMIPQARIVEEAIKLYLDENEPTK